MCDFINLICSPKTVPSTEGILGLVMFCNMPQMLLNIIIEKVPVGYGVQTFVVKMYKCAMQVRAQIQEI